MSSADPSVGALRLRPRTIVLFAFVGILSVGAVVLRSPVPLLAALPLLVVPLASAGSRPSSLRRADLSWEATGLGPEVNLSGVVRGPFGPSAPDISVVPRPFPGAALRGPVRVEGGPAEVRFEFSWTLAEPAMAQLEPPQVVWRDPLGLVEEPVPGDRPSLAIERYPPELHRLGSVRLERTLQLPGEARSRRLGSSGEFFGIRDAAPNEPPRLINWRATARTGRLLANDFQLDRTGDLLLLLDVRPTTLGAVVDERLLGIARAGLYGIAESLLRGKVRVGYASFGEFVQGVPLSTGRAHRVRLKQAILTTQRSSVSGPPDRCTFGLRRYFRPGLTTLLVSSWQGDSYFDLLPYLHRSGFPAILVSPSPLSLGTGGAPLTDDTEERIVRRLERAERRARLASLWEHGPVIDWTDFWSLDGLVHFLRQPSRRRLS